MAFDGSYSAAYDVYSFPNTVDPTGYATIGDYELRTGVDVPPEQEPTVQTRLNDVSALMKMYMGECADEVEAKFPDILTAACVSQAYTIGSVPPGVRAESVGGTSVSYADNISALRLPSPITDLLDELMERACGPNAELPGVGTVGAHWGGPWKAQSETAWMRDVDVWVI